MEKKCADYADFEPHELKQHLSQKFNVGIDKKARKRVKVLRPVYEIISSYEEELSESDSDEDCINEICDIKEELVDTEPQLEDNVASESMQEYISFQYKGILKHIKKLMKWRPMGPGLRYYVSGPRLYDVLSDVKTMRDDPEAQSFDVIDVDSIYTE